MGLFNWKRRDDNPPPAVPDRFAVWRRSPDSNGDLIAEVPVRNGVAYHVSLRMDPARGIIAEIALRHAVAPGADMTASQLLPPFTIRNLREPHSGAFLRATIKDDGQPIETQYGRLVKALRTLLYDTDIGQFHDAGGVMRARLESGGAYQLLAQCCRAGRDIPPAISAALYKELPFIPASEFAPAASFIADHFERLAAPHRPRIAARLIEQLIAHECDPLLTGLCCRPEMRGAEKKSLLAYAEGLNGDTAQSLVAILLGSTHDNAVTALRSLFANQKLVAPEARPRFLHTLSEKALTRDLLHMLLTELPDPRWKKVEPSKLRGLSPDLALQAVREHPETYLRRVIFNCASFEGLTPQDAILAAATQTRPDVSGRSGVLESGLALCSGLEKTAAQKLVRASCASAVLTCLDSFSLTTPETADLLRDIAEQGQAKTIVDHLDQLPRTALQRLESQHHFIAFLDEVGIKDFGMYEDYLEIFRQRDPVTKAEFLSSIASLVEGALSSNPQPPDVTDHRYYRPVIRQIYRNNSSRSADFEWTEACPDRSAALQRFTIRKVYRIDLSEGVTMVLKDGQDPDQNAHRQLEHTIESALQDFQNIHYDREKMWEVFDKKVASFGSSLSPAFRTREEKLFGLFLNSLVGHVPAQPLRQLVLMYEFAADPDVAAYVAGTRDRSNRAKNPEYAQLLLLREHFADKVRDCIIHVCERSASNPAIAGLLPNFYTSFQALEQTRRWQEALNRSQAHRLGVTPALLDNLARILENRSLVTTQKYRAVAGIIEKEQQKVAALLGEITGETPPAHTVSLRNFDPARPPPTAPSANGHDLFRLNLFFAAQATRLFDDEIRLIDRETGKYRPDTSTGRRAMQINAYITLNHSSAHARAVAGLCIAGDNPEADSRHMLSQWNLPNYLQLVLFDPQLTQCEGLALLHEYEENGERILTASFNPTSTYLYKVDERQLFNGMLRALITFATDSSFDIIACSANSAIRTNRTGGEFEHELVQQIARCNRRIRLAQPRPFSFSPKYMQQELDVLWQRPPLT